MNKFALATAAVVATTSMANAGGIDRSGQFLGPLWEEGGETGSYFQMSVGTVSPTARSAQSDPLQNYQPWAFAAKVNLSDKLSFAFIADQPYGADVGYTAPALGGAFANISSQAFTGVLRYKLNDNFSVHGGLRAQKFSGALQTTARLTADSELALGYLIGAAYERPDIAMRVALTYNSAIDNKFDGLENFAPTSFEMETPESVNLEFQTGVAADTLLFGSIRHVMWEGFNLTSPSRTYATFTDDTTTYSVGLGRRFSETWSGAVTLGYEAKGNYVSSTALAPTTGQTSIGLGATYTVGNTELTAGVTYAKLGDTQAGGIPFSGSSLVGAGVRLGFNF